MKVILILLKNMNINRILYTLTASAFILIIFFIYKIVIEDANPNQKFEISKVFVSFTDLHQYLKIDSIYFQKTNDFSHTQVQGIKVLNKNIPVAFRKISIEDFGGSKIFKMSFERGFIDIDLKENLKVELQIVQVKKILSKNVRYGIFFNNYETNLNQIDTNKIIVSRIHLDL
ncbi:MAG: hypothetical protein IPP05_10570 [Cytophagaceae bacterium]|nr:hypothetical protein [Cytophagaceae bacterium]